MVEKTILCVDDEEYILHALNRLFTMNDFKVYTAQDGPSALNILAEHGDKIQLLISDQRMPGMPGEELIKRVKESHPHIIRIMLSAYMDFNALTAAVNEGEIYKFVFKPWDDKELLRLIEESLERRHILMQLQEMVLSFKTLIEQIDEVNFDSSVEKGTLCIRAKQDNLVVPPERLSNFIAMIIESIERKKDEYPDLNLAGHYLTKRGSKLLLEIEVGKGVTLSLELPSVL